MTHGSTKEKINRPSMCLTRQQGRSCAHANAQINKQE